MWVVADLDDDYIASMEDVLEVYCTGRAGQRFGSKLIH
jgi:hypothetical protein